MEKDVSRMNELYKHLHEIRNGLIESEKAQTRIKNGFSGLLDFFDRFAKQDMGDSDGQTSTNR